MKTYTYTIRGKVQAENESQVGTAIWSQLESGKNQVDFDEVEE